MEKILLWFLALTLCLPSTLVTIAFWYFLRFPLPLRHIIPSIIKEEKKAAIKISLYGWGAILAIVAVFLT